MVYLEEIEAWQQYQQISSEMMRRFVQFELCLPILIYVVEQRWRQEARVAHKLYDKN